jgi:hypothetical protein
MSPVSARFGNPILSSPIRFFRCVPMARNDSVGARFFRAFFSFDQSQTA